MEKRGVDSMVNRGGERGNGSLRGIWVWEWDGKSWDLNRLLIIILMLITLLK